MWRFGRSRACFGTILFFWIYGFLMCLFICDALLLYHTTWLWLHFLVFGTDNGLHAVCFFPSCWSCASFLSLSISFPFLVLAGFDRGL